jgi:hypothetical protein
MSYILDALKRAEQQRGAPARGAASLPRAIATDFEPRARWPWIAAGGVGLVIAAGIAFWPAREATSPVATASAPSAVPMATPAPPPPAGIARVGPTPAAAPVGPERVVNAPAGARVPEAQPPARRPTAAIDRPSPPAAATARSGAGGVPLSPAPRPAPPVEERASATPPAAVAPVTPPPAVRPAPPPPAAVARVTPPQAVSPAPAPPPAASGDLDARAAKLSIQVLSWAPERKDRFVFLNGRKYGEGQTVEGTFLVEQITEDSVVLSAQGKRVTLKGR